ncbi:MAG: hypothetical protein AAFQ36_13775 [Pseudomonadota bacterium]
MSDLDALEERIGAALGRIRAALEARAEETANMGVLQERLAAVEEKRAADVAQLDALIAELRPLVEESVDA